MERNPITEIEQYLKNTDKTVIDLNTVFTTYLADVNLAPSKENMETLATMSRQIEEIVKKSSTVKDTLSLMILLMELPEYTNDPDMTEYALDEISELSYKLLCPDIRMKEANKTYIRNLLSYFHNENYWKLEIFIQLYNAHISELYNIYNSNFTEI